MIMGGVPYYLSLLSNKLSLEQNIDKLFFMDGGELWDEFAHLYKTLFSNSDSYIRVVEALSKKKGGLTREEIIHEIDKPSGGDLTKILNDLILSGFVRANKEKDISGAQIDLLISRRDRVITICEIKFSRGEFEIKKDYDLSLRNKIEAFKQATNCKESIQLIMITTYGVKRNQYSSVIQNQVTMNDLFIVI